jgi:hypothetical protein
LMVTSRGRGRQAVPGCAWWPRCPPQKGLFDFRFLLDGQGGDDAREIAAIMVEAIRLLAVVTHVGLDRVQKEQTTKSGPRCLESHVHPGGVGGEWRRVVKARSVSIVRKSG